MTGNSPCNLADLPKELLLNIFFNLEINALINLKSTCKTFSPIVSHVLIALFIDAAKTNPSGITLLCSLKKLIKLIDDGSSDADKEQLKMVIHQLLKKVGQEEADNNSTYELLEKVTEVKHNNIILIERSSPINWIKQKLCYFFEKQTLSKTRQLEKKTTEDLKNYWEKYLSNDSLHQKNKLN